ncbi:hypothetical protein BJV78DRAFT_661677 [Lactifluus subvellereus]|nr:hypothetical protein BJV78DRAFT_661677 [Lactifluus subvellereus]
MSSSFLGLDELCTVTLNVPNYAGSSGFGDFYVQELIGKCSTLDVQDVKAAVDHLVEEGKGEYGHGKQFVTGGSHAGFLTARLIGQYPDTFTAAVLRNPVIMSQPTSTDKTSQIGTFPSSACGRRWRASRCHPRCQCTRSCIRPRQLPTCAE